MIGGIPLVGPRGDNPLSQNRFPPGFDWIFVKPPKRIQQLTDGSARIAGVVGGVPVEGGPGRD